MIQKWDGRFLDLAKLVSTWSKDPSTKVGAVIVKDINNIVSVGYNGFPKGMPDYEWLYSDRIEKYSRIIHGEVNAVLHAYTSPQDCTLYTYPFLPCDRCFVQMLQVGIMRFVAPKIVDEDLMSRWGEAIEKVKKYAKEVGVEITEVDYE